MFAVTQRQATVREQAVNALTLQNFFRKFSFPAAGVLVSVALGAPIGLLIGHRITLRLVNSRLTQYASSILIAGEASSSDARSVLALMNSSPYPVCSHSESDYFRQILLRSEYIKEAGRIQDGKIVCSTTLGGLQQPFALPKANFF